MLAHLRSNAVAYVALCIALGGTSYAAVKLPKGSVGTKQIKKNAVTSAKVRNGTLLADDFKAGQLPPGPRGEQGAQGERGPAGADGADGAPGAQGVSGPTGPVGSVYGKATMNGEPGDPSPTPDGDQVGSFDFMVPEGGDFYVAYFIPRVAVTCSAGDRHLGLYLDGAPVFGTQVFVEETPTARQLVFMRELEPGGHTVAAQLDCPGGNVTDVLFTAGAWTVLQLSDNSIL